MNPWTVVKVTNEASENAGRVGYVLRNEQRGSAKMTIVKLDETAEEPGEVLGFDASEIQAL